MSRNAITKESSNYVSPMRNDMEQMPFYNEQEQSYTDLSQLDSQHGTGDGNTNYYDLYMKMNVHPTQEVTNPDWGGGNMLSPKENPIQKDFNRTPNDDDHLYDVSASTIIDLGNRASRVVDAFLADSSNEIIKIGCMDLTDFMKVSDETLIHKSNKDLWRMMKDKEGNVYIQRLFEGDLLKD